MHFSVITLKQAMLAFWAIWLTIVCLANLCDLLKRWRVLGDHWKFASGNYDLMQKSTRVYHLPDAAVLLLFIGVVIWEALAGFLTWNALLSFNGSVSDAVYAAFGVSLALWAAFLIADEIFMAYEMETTHIAIFIAQLISLIALVLLPSVLK